MRTALVAAGLVGLLGSGCGLGWVDTEPDPAAGLPTSGAGPYGRLAIDDLTPALEPQLVVDRRADLSDPSVLAGDGDRVRVWMARRADGETATTIAYAEAPSARDLTDVGPSVVMTATEPWEGGSVGAPHVIETADGLVMYYQGGTPTTGPFSIGVARSSDGMTWQKVGMVLADASAPSAVVVNGATWLFVTRPGVEGIWRAVDTGAGFALDAAPVVTPRPGLANAFDTVSVGDPFAIATPTFDPAMIRVGLWFTGLAAEPERPAVGYAASFDGVTWERFGAEKAQLLPPATGPTVLLGPSYGLMLFAELDRGHLTITAAEHP